MRNFIFMVLIMLLTCAVSHAEEFTFKYGSDMNAKWGDASTYTPYMALPAEMTAPYAGASIKKVRLGVWAPAKNVYLYVKNYAHDDASLYKKKVGELRAGWNEIDLEEPVVIEEGIDLAIGYKATFESTGGVGYSTESFPNAAMIYQNANTSWVSLTGSLSIEVILEGDNLPKHELRMSSVADFKAPLASDMATITSKVRNGGTGTVTSFGICYSTDNGEPATKTIECNMAPNEYAEFSFKVPSSEPGQHTVNCTITNVNGVVDEYADNNTFTVKMTVLNPEYARVAVCEEGTGLWCGWCPRGMVGMELMKEQHPNNFLAVSIHGGDVMEIPSEYPHSYREILNQMEGFPTCFMSRRTKGDPYSSIAHMYDSTMSSESPMNISGTAEWNEDKTAINITAEITTNPDITTATPPGLYNIAYILVEDGITGYLQTNYYGDGKNGYMYGWEEKSEHTRDVVFNDVARGIFPNVYGEALPALLGDGEPTTVHYTLTLPVYEGKKKDYDVQDKDNVRVVGIVLNNNTNYIETAFSASPNSKTNGIDTHEILSPRGGQEGVSLSTIHDAYGRTVNSTKKSGLYIIKNGTETKKIYIK